MHNSTKKYDCKLFKDKMVTLLVFVGLRQIYSSRHRIVFGACMKKTVLVYVLIIQKNKESISLKLLMCSGLVSDLKYM